MKSFFTILFLICILTNSVGQNLFVQHDGSVLYISHVVSAKENWYSISRMYSASPKDLVTINQTSLEMGLAITQKIKIPLTSNNFIQSEKISSKDDLVPIYHLILDKEGLYRIGLMYNKVPVSRLKLWNNLSSDAVKSGNSLIIGYLKLKKDTVLSTSSIVVNKTPDENKFDTIINKKVTVAPTIANEQPQKPVNNPLKKVKKDEKPSIKTGKAVTSDEKPASKTVVTESDKKGSGIENLFLENFNSQNKGKPQNNLNGLADIFKSNSGWNDGKYYVLMNSLAPGTIVKIVALTSNLAVYAKVLGSIPPGKENEGLTIRISNAASAQLKAGEGRFEVKISW